MLIIASRSPCSPRRKDDASADHVVRVVPLVGLGMPSFWLGIILLLVFGAAARPAVPGRRLRHGLLGHLHSMFLPALTVAIGARADADPQPAREHARACSSPTTSTTAPAKGAVRAPRARPARAAQRGHPDDHRARRQHRLPDRRHRGRSRRSSPCPGIGQLMIDVDRPARLPGRAGRDARVRRAGRARQPAHRHHVRAPRPAGEVRLMSAIASLRGRPAVERRRRAPAQASARRWYRTPSLRRRARRSSASIVLLASAAPLITPLRPDRPGPAAHAAGARRRSTGSAPTSSAATSGRACVYGAPHRPADRVPRRAPPVHASAPRSACSPATTAAGRHGRDAPRRRRRRLPVLRADHRARLRARPGRAQHLHRDHDRRLGVVRAHRPRRDPRRQAAGVRARRACRRAVGRRASSSATCCRT